MNSNPSSSVSLKRILFATDFSPNAALAFDHAVDAALRAPGSTLYLLHVIPEPDAQFWKTYLYEVEDIDEKAKKDIDDKIAVEYLPHVPEGVDVQVEIRIGKAHDVIIDFARENQIDLIVLGRHGHTGLGRVISGNVTRSVVQKTPCPVLVVPLNE